MRNEQTRASLAHDGHERRNELLPARRFTRAMDCGADGQDTCAMQQASVPAARALGTPRDGGDEIVDEGAPHAA